MPKIIFTDESLLNKVPSEEDFSEKDPKKDPKLAAKFQKFLNVYHDLQPSR